MTKTVPMDPPCGITIYKLHEGWRERGILGGMDRQGGCAAQPAVRVLAPVGGAHAQDTVDGEAGASNGMESSPMTSSPAIDSGTIR